MPAAFDLAKLEVSGDPVRIEDGVIGGLVSGSGMLAYRTGAATDLTQMTRFDRMGKALGVIEPAVAALFAGELLFCPQFH